MKQKHFFDVQFDFPIVGIVSALLLIGILSVYVAVSHDYPQMVWSFLGQQLAWIGMGCFICLIVTIFNTKFLWQITPFLYVLGLALMVLPLIFYNPSLVASTGAKNWVAYGNITLFQPSEFMKIPFILMLSRSIVQFLQRNKGRERLLRQDWFLILELTIYTIPVFVLLALQQDLGTALVFMAIFAGLVLVSGVSWKIILPVVFVLVGGVAGFLFLFLSEGGRAFLHQQLGMPTYQMNRILAWLNPFDYAQTTTYQQAQGQLAIASGGLFGQGFNVSNLLVPVRESDMIFTVLGEDFGFAGSLVFLILYVCLIYRILKITLQSNNQFYTYISIGFIMMLVFHIFENIGAVTGILPLTGIPLPFVSQGGSAIISNLIGIGLVLSIHNQSVKKKKVDPPAPVRKKVVLKKAQ
ncbi:FtsW/RodA/SpoVE family cell cycle protein [Streptococcus lactarius]|uniref:FtsW/RodA/SpoVE family cell cycle protein n=1 Tax=Streptococcus lactarius TaxID=684066 RepID=A0A9X0WPF5_9STRE|nr:FtsW/RodA/SpoVE family cell cycle protein [Streptococcus lactarius]MBK4779649.1 rod shape-determining protein RodA [Streptococcus lactarius]QUB38360.1 FtsW/RodA/SpoVE family cell cycle protein [Streptococcus lactarius]